MPYCEHVPEQSRGLRTSLVPRGQELRFRSLQTQPKFLSKLDTGYQIAKKLHNVLTPALKDAGVHKHTKKGLSDFESIRGKVLGAHESAERVVRNVKRAVPELGL